MTLRGVNNHSISFSFSPCVCLDRQSCTEGLKERAWQDSRCFLGHFVLHGRSSRPPTYLVATPGIWCFEKPRSSTDSDRQGLCVLSVWKRQGRPGICFQLLPLRRHRRPGSWWCGFTQWHCQLQRKKNKKYNSAAVQTERSVCQPQAATAGTEWGTVVPQIATWGQLQKSQNNG